MSWGCLAPVQRLRVYYHRDVRLRISLFAVLGFMTLVNVAYLVTMSKF